ncbi:MAG: hypothetical protein N2035_10655, partial [Chthoniobacterales bacterium]|nr:hypothetical protein [Chthoniobacterales bacterium]
IYTFPATETLKKRGKYTAQVDWNYGDKHVKKTFEYSIDREDVNQAEKIDLASQGIKVPTNAIIIKPVHLIGGTAVILILGVIIFILLLRNKKKCKK